MGKSNNNSLLTTFSEIMDLQSDSKPSTDILEVVLNIMQNYNFKNESLEISGLGIVIDKPQDNSD